MALWHSLRLGLRGLFHKEVAARELDDELRHYLEQLTAEKIGAGLAPEAARRAAILEIGGLEATKTQVREGGWETRVDSLGQDLRYALRGLRRTPGFTAIAVATLGLGIGVNTAIFSVVNAVIFRPLPYHEANRLALLWTDDARRGLHREGTAYLTVSDWQRVQSFSEVGYFSTQRVAVLSDDPGADRSRSRKALVSGNLFSVLGVAPLKGRVVSPADLNERGLVAVISYGLWQRWFDGAPDIVGRSLTMDDASRGSFVTLTVIGVMPAGFYFPDRQTELWVPATTYWRFTRESTERFVDWARRWTGVARLAPGATSAETRAELGRLSGQLAATNPTTVEGFPGFGVTMVPVLDTIASTELQSTLWVLLGAVALVLLVACANVASLLLARGVTRQQEFSVRRALGAGRGRIVRQLVIEHVVLGLVAGLAGTLVAAATTRLVGRLAAAYVPRMDEIAVDARVLGFALVASLLAGLLSGLAPALRVSSSEASDALREGARGTGNPRLSRTRGLLVVAECALAIVLLTGAGLLVRSLVRLRSVDAGFNPRQVVSVRLEFPSQSRPSAEERNQPGFEQNRAQAEVQRMEGLLARLAGTGGVESVGFIDDLFVTGQGHGSITFPGRDASSFAPGQLNEARVTPGFFTALRVPIRRGRVFTSADVMQKIRALWSPSRSELPLAERERLAIPEPVVVNEAFVQRFFRDEDPIGKRFCIDPENKTYWYEIVGVVGDMHRSGLERSTIAEYFGPYFPSPSGRADLLVRNKGVGDPLALVATIRRIVSAELPGVSIVSVATAESQLDDFSRQRRFQTWLLSGFALLALVLAAIGIFGLVHYAVAERTREIGVRVALGATPSRVLGMLVAQGMRMPVMGIAAGLLAAIGLTRVMASLLFGVGATDLVTLAGVAVVLSGAALVACYLAGRRATRVDPVTALRG